MKDEKEYSQEAKDAFNRLIDTYEKVEFDGITILTGSNGSGKSMIRKQLIFAIARDKDIEPKEAGRLISSTSMDARTGSNPEMGAMSGMMRDDDWIATSQSTYSNLKGLFSAAEKEKTCEYLVIDEFEIGCGEETILALSQYINKNLKRLIKGKKIRGGMIITHSRLGVEELVADRFINIEGMTKDEWLDREIFPTNLAKLDENELFFVIRQNQHEKD